MGKYDHLEIDDSLHKGLPSLTKDELETLKANIVKDGKITDPVIAWGNIVVDGRNRVRISRETGIEFDVAYKNFCDNDEARDWIINRALGRRNLSIETRKMLLGELYINRKKAASAAASANGEKTSDSTGQIGQRIRRGGGRPAKETQPSVEAAQKVAAETKTSERSVRRAGEYFEATQQLAEPVREAVTSKEVKATHAQVKQLATMKPEAQQKAIDAVKAGNVAKLADALPKKRQQGASVRKSTAQNVIKAYGGLVRALEKAGDASKNKKHHEKCLERLNRIHDEQFVPWLLEEFGYEVKKAEAA